MKYHYTYRISNIKLNKHYYGARTSTKKSSEDIGIYYFSSSKDKDFIIDQKNNPGNYNYKVVSIHNSRLAAMEYEIKLHNKFNVGINEAFYNRTKSSSTGFDRTGCQAPNFGKQHSEEVKKKISDSNKGAKWHIAREGKLYGMEGKTHSEETKLKMSKTHSGVLKSKETKLKMKKPKSLEHIEKLKTCKKATKIIYLYNNKDLEINKFESITIFRNYCKDAGLPYKKLIESYYEATGPIDNIRQVEKRKYEGWYLR